MHFSRSFAVFVVCSDGGRVGEYICVAGKLLFRDSGDWGGWVAVNIFFAVWVIFFFTCVEKYLK